jgi:hypothetical protein
MNDKKLMHWSDCAVHSEPAYPAGECDCGLVPVAWADKHDIEREGHDFYVNRQQPAKDGVPLYTAPSQEPQIKQRTGDCLLTGVCASEGHKLTPNYVDRRQWKYDPMTGNRLAQPEPAPTNNGRYLTGYKAQPEPEPVAWAWVVNSGAGYYTKGVGFDKTDIPFAKHTPLYTAPPQREWQGLTEEEKLIVNQMWNMVGVDGSIKAIETRLKEKNA